jgi:hypothetical protein
VVCKYQNTTGLFEIYRINKNSELVVRYIIWVMWTREEIIRETQRLAKAKGGKAPSEKELKEAGIKNYYWHKFWSKITDLQKETGLAPNTFLKPVYELDDLREKFIFFMRDLKAWPSKAEIEVKHNEEKIFPGSTIFYRKLGTIKVFANDILEYAKKHGYEDIVRICEETIEKYSNHESEDGKNEEVKHGWVYLIKHGSFNHYRIGQTYNRLRRWKENKIELPEEPNLIHEIETVDPAGVETYWHNRFESKKTTNKSGDWFKLASVDVKEFKAWRKIV